MVVDKSNERVRKMFSEIAPNYDRMNHLLSMNIDHYWRWYAVRKLAPNRRDPILDVCTGTGDLAIAFHKYTAGEIEIMGSDFCGPMLKVAIQKANKSKRYIQFIKADSQRLPFQDDYFQVVSVAFGLRNVADTDLGLREMLRSANRVGKSRFLNFQNHVTNGLKVSTIGTSKTCCHGLANCSPATIRVRTTTCPTALTSFHVMNNLPSGCWPQA